MSADIPVSRWAADQFGVQAAEVVKRLVSGLIEAQRSAWDVQEFAAQRGASNRRPYGSMWDSRYKRVVDALRDLEGFRLHHPKHASYDLAVINGKVLIPFRHATTLTVPIAKARIRNAVPIQVSRDFGVGGQPTLFDEFEIDTGAGEAAEVAAAEGLSVVYVAYVANAESDGLLAAWWGEADALEDDGTLFWNPEKLPLAAIAGVIGDNAVRRVALTDVPASFAEGEEPALNVSSRSAKADAPSPEIEPVPPTTADGDE